MSDALLVIAIVVGMVLAFVMFIEYREYKNYVRASKALVALGEGMKVGFEQMTLQMGRFNAIQTALTLDAEEKDTKIQLLELVQATHSEALMLKLLIGANSPKPKGIPEDVTGI